jgi:hypothetical protein
LQFFSKVSYCRHIPEDFRFLPWARIGFYEQETVGQGTRYRLSR